MSINIPIICIPTLSRNDLLERLFKSMRTDIYNIDKIVIIDNSFYNYSMVKTIEYIKNNFSNIDVISNGKNIGVSSSWNYCIKNYDYDYYFILNDDIELDQYSLYKMKTIVKKTISRNIIVSGVNGTGFHIFSLNRQTIDDIGLFDELFYPAYFEDFDYIKRVELFGGRQLKFNDGVIHGDKDYNSSSTIFNNFVFNNRKDILLKGSHDYWVYKHNSLYKNINTLSKTEHNEWVSNKIDYVRNNFFNNPYNKLNDENILNIIYILNNSFDIDYLVNLFGKFKDVGIESHIYIFSKRDKIVFNNDIGLSKYNIYTINVELEGIEFYNNILDNALSGYIYITDNLMIDDDTVILIKDHILNNRYQYLDIDISKNENDITRYMFHKNFIKYCRFIDGEFLSNTDIINRSKENL